MAHMTGVPALNRKELVDFQIPIPPLDEQERIVEILDRFDTLCTDLTSGLPAEIAARKQQYEYYRDKLLTFREKVA
jgi:type I restriction enzyme S subunit